MSVVEFEQKIEMPAWLSMVEGIRRSPDWSADELPVELKQTHISTLLLGRNHVMKLKKPVDFGFLDYTTLEKRLAACLDELRLNCRLCPQTYIGVGEIREVDGELRFSGRRGRIVDYCVWMHRLPDERMLDRMVAEGTVGETVIDRIARRLSGFHATAVRGPEIDRWGSTAEIRHNWEENFEQTAPYVGRTISEKDYQSIKTWVDRYFKEKADLFERRVRERRIVDGHGDIRCESICVKDDDICIYDCIEFNDRFRCGDIASEVAFLAMDLDARGRPDLGYYFTESYQQLNSDGDLFKLLPFYRCYRAYVRGKVLSFRLDEAEFSDAERRAASTRAAAYFELARRYASPLQYPAVIAVGGLSGTGKSSIARALAGELGLRVASSDAVRQSLFCDIKRPAAYGEGAYTAEASRLTYQKMFDLGRQLFAERNGVILDATFRRAEDLAVAQEMSKAAGARLLVIECILTPEQVRARLERRTARGEGNSDATWEIYLKQREEGESLSIGAHHPQLIIDTSG
ncbi:MAG: AAA family ATPase, partial [Blastocatellia bacterium]|nr:AAA family ATPase [Blastocatellia bacterium]